MPSVESLRRPTDAEIDAVEQRLGRKFHPDYRAFLRNGGDVADARFEPAVVLPGAGHLDLFAMTQRAWTAGVAKNLLPFIEDNGDYHCLTETGEVVYWSHDGAAAERWPDLKTWRDAVCVRRP